MEESLIIIISSVTILSLVFLFLYFKKSQEYFELKQRVKELESAELHNNETQKMRDDFLAMVIHELRAPLAVTKGSADLLLKEASRLSKEQIFDLLTQIRDSSTDLLGMVTDMLDVSKIESGRFEVFKRDWSLNELLTAESHRYHGLAKDNDLTLTMHLDPKVSRVPMDPDRIKQVMNNLLSNAIKFTPRGGKVDIVSEKTDGKVRVIVADTGIGIPEEMKNKLFHKFVQGRAKAFDGEKGTGLGLVIAKGIVEAHGGSIWMEDNKPHGSKFIFTLPLS